MPIGDRAKSYSYAAYVYPSSKDAGAEIIYSAECEDKNNVCANYSNKRVNERFFAIISSIKFKLAQKDS